MSESLARLVRSAEKDLGGFSVRRVLPGSGRRAVGPFVFFDHIGPAEFPPGKGVQVRPHPHIGLETVTYLFEGELIHRDSLGCVQPIRPGAVNLMTAGRGIVHSERAGEDLHTASRLHGIQIWLGLPLEDEECEPAFAHYSAQDIPEFRAGDVPVRLVMGSAFGRTSPVKTRSTVLYLDCRLPAGGVLEIPGDWPELGAFVVSGDVHVDGAKREQGLLVIAEPGRGLSLHAESRESHVMVLGGEPLGKRIVWWNLVSSSRERIEKAKRDWKEGRFDKIPGETEFIPLPEDAF